jgi:hypothetical protein
VICPSGKISLRYGVAPYFGTTAERRNALFHDYQMKYYGVSW